MLARALDVIGTHISKTLDVVDQLSHDASRDACWNAIISLHGFYKWVFYIICYSKCFK